MFLVVHTSQAARKHDLLGQFAREDHLDVDIGEVHWVAGGVDLTA
jgi:hypothetical protein